MRGIKPQLELSLSDLEEACKRFLTENLHFFEDKPRYTEHLEAIKTLLEEIKVSKRLLERAFRIFDNHAQHVSLRGFR